jgi:hypothetical protein
MAASLNKPQIMSSSHLRLSLQIVCMYEGWATIRSLQRDHHWSVSLRIGPFSPHFLTRILYDFLVSPVRDTCPCHVISWFSFSILRLRAQIVRLWKWVIVSLYCNSLVFNCYNLAWSISLGGRGSREYAGIFYGILVREIPATFCPFER